MPSMPTDPSVFMTYTSISIDKNGVDEDDVSLDKPTWVHDPDLQRPSTATPADHSCDKLAMDVEYRPTHLIPGSTSKRARNYSHPDNQRDSQTCAQELARFNERLLCEARSSEPTAPGPSFGQTLRHCQDFLSVLRRFRASSCGDNFDTATEWPCSPTLSPGGSSAYQNFSRLSSASPSFTSPSASLDIPTVLSILFCYTYILQSFDDLLTPIHAAVTQSSPVVPATLVGLRLDGFNLDSHPALQLECLVNISWNRLEKIENTLLGGPGYTGILTRARHGVLGDKLFAGLLDALYEPKEPGILMRANGKREVRAKRLIREIQASLESTDL
ncbi:hypothetical protein P168DRAFT_326447 [Aspergillus campestris IBT 28561]|uniref:Uncharacterized protein n=1 Tax=Aspergillus campestris (strain IBT 28561) TaxID=1392248 RepID=A0A2I1D435_ASPC2|nr:uncharacterized protein P168DRAFT_326447 [Aspergillus campestris IBT 28561]PKY04629.1 hypothetical protein P168DRAFT_326447 [Aspergillus campestris IBT 28561]